MKYLALCFESEIGARITLGEDIPITTERDVNHNLLGSKVFAEVTR